MKKEKAYLYIEKSSIPSCGDGLFTSIAIKRGERICNYGGRLIGSKEFDEILASVKQGDYNMEDANYYISLSSGLILDSSASSCFGRYANDAEGHTQVKCYKNNAKITEGEDKISAYLEALTDIPKGGEVFASYGESYWKGFEK